MLAYALVVRKSCFFLIAATMDKADVWVCWLGCRGAGFAKGRRIIMETQGTNKINCNKCKYFYITWEKEFPYGCKAMGFKSKNMPNRVTREVSQRQCLSFEPKDELR
jgi:hypothetical protein